MLKFQNVSQKPKSLGVKGKLYSIPLEKRKMIDMKQNWLAKLPKHNQPFKLDDSHHVLPQQQKYHKI